MNETRKFILDTAFRLFLQKTFKEVTMQEIVSATKLSKGAFYHHFKSKEQLFGEVIANFFDLMMQREHTLNPAITLYDYYHWCAERTISLQKMVGTDDGAEVTLNFYYMIFDALKMLPGFRDTLRRQQDQEHAAWMEVIRRAKSSGEITSTLGTREIASIFIHTGDGFSLELVLDGNPRGLKRKILKVWGDFYKTLK